MSKAIVLPINILVVIVIATVATLGLVGVYGVGFSPFSTTFNLESVKNSACRELVMGGCKANSSDIMVKYDANKNGVNDTGKNFNWNTGVGNDNLAALCYNFFGRKSDVLCRQMCGCFGSTNMSSGGPCTPQCTGKVCGSNKCGGTCPPGCILPQTCNAAGQCVACVSNCAGKQCGPNGCGGGCPPGCTLPQTCNAAGQCVGCVPLTCAQMNRECGNANNGCGNIINCGSCSSGTCDTDGQCITDNSCRWKTDGLCLCSLPGIPGNDFEVRCGPPGCIGTCDFSSQDTPCCPGDPPCPAAPVTSCTT